MNSNLFSIINPDLCINEHIMSDLNSQTVVHTETKWRQGDILISNELDGAETDRTFLEK